MKNGQHFADNILNWFPWMKCFALWIKFHPYLLWSSFYNKSSQVLAISWLQTGNKPLPESVIFQFHYCDVMMGVIVSQITSLMIVYSIVHSSADQRKHQSTASLAFVPGIHQWLVNSQHKRPVMRKMFPFDDDDDDDNGDSRWPTANADGLRRRRCHFNIKDSKYWNGQISKKPLFKLMTLVWKHMLHGHQNLP